ncbi:MAG: aldo/keto reductase, partial [bacterium]
TPAQILLRWGLERDLVVLPNSTHAERIRENIALVDISLDPPALAALDALEEGLATAWDPRSQP